MKTKLFILLTCIFYVGIYGQFTSTNHIITNTADGVRNLDVADINGDGFIDVLSASVYDDTVAWYENTNGQGTFIEHIITDKSDAAYSVYPADINDDGYMDVVYASRTTDTVAWRENTDGLGNFGEEQIITTSADSVIDVFSADFDGDGDMDVLSASQDDDKVAWYENTNGQGSFGPELVITDQANYVYSVYADDIDGDDNMDVISSSAYDGKLAWHENTDGLGSFDEHIIATNIQSWEVCAGDLDGDDDVDVLAAINTNATLVWYENTDGQGDFEEHILELDAGCGGSISVVDIDDDDDMDILTTEFVNDKVCYYENDGNEIFTKHLITSGDGAVSARAAHINDEGFLDVVSGWFHLDTIVWTENYPHSSGVDENTLVDFSIYPIPTTGILTIQSDFIVSQIEIYNQLGQLIMSKSNQDKIDISILCQGLYFCKVKDENGASGIKKIVKE